MESKKYEPWEELPEKNLEKVRILTDAIHAATDNIEYNLATDTIKVPGQNWACVSFVSPQSNQKNNSIGMKIRGVFDKQEEAVDYVKQLIRIDPTFDIFVCEMYNWCLVPPDPEKVGDQVYQNEELNKIVSEYRKNQIYAKEHFEERKREMVEYAAEQARQDALRKLKERETLTITEGEEIVNDSSESTPSQIMDSMMNDDCPRPTPCET
jgi:excinuclease UvrABC nuclease subunit